ncbi:MAG TPA: hypothetical protein VGN72_03935 [Tepidisphaeraceae bacterium]|jgi:hypothetical protein|nr:hypothetical protein [Tepidisphaeraceae bacterium]
MCVTLAGCATKGMPQIDPLYAPIETASLDYWFDRPPSVVVQDVDYDRLWKACEDAVDDRFFDFERRDYRSGILTSRPLLGGQLLEFWRRDLPDAYSIAESSLGTVRRTIQFELRVVGPLVEAYPKVVVERRASQDRRVTLGVLNRNALSGATVQGYNDFDPPVANYPQYWYAVRRDENLEAKLAEDVKRRLPD